MGKNLKKRLTTKKPFKTFVALKGWGLLGTFQKGWWAHMGLLSRAIDTSYGFHNKILFCHLSRQSYIFLLLKIFRNFWPVRVIYLWFPSSEKTGSELMEKMRLTPRKARGLRERRSDFGTK